MTSSRLAGATAMVLANVMASMLAVTGCFHSAAVSDAGASADASHCNTLAPSQILVQPTGSLTTPPPAAMGGTLVAGAYHLAATVYYPTASCTTTEVSTNLRLTLASPTSGTIETVTVTAAGDSVSETTLFMAAGTELTLSLTCISPDTSGFTHTAAVLPYTVSPAGELLLSSSDPSCGASVSTYVPDGT